VWVIVSELAFQLFALVALGFVLRRFGVIDDNFQKRMGNLLILVVLPAAILSSANTPFSEEMGMSLIWAFLFILFFYVAGIILLRIATRAVRYPEQNRHLLINLLMFANTGFLGFPVVQYIYGGQGVLYAVIFNLLFNFFLFTYGVMMLGGREITWKKFLLSPLTISMVVTIILFVTRLEMPNFIVGVLDKLGGLSAPLSMFIVEFECDSLEEAVDEPSRVLGDGGGSVVASCSHDAPFVGDGPAGRNAFDDCSFSGASACDLEYCDCGAAWR